MSQNISHQQHNIQGQVWSQYNRHGIVRERASAVHGNHQNNGVEANFLKGFLIFACGRILQNSISAL